MTVSSFLPDAAVKNDLLQPPTDIVCPNCGTLIAGRFCQGCGQPAHLHVPSAREFLHEFIAHYVALEGKLWKSVALLLFRPGRLTRDYIEGKRVRYVEPLRLYLSFSIIFFAIFKLSGNSFGNFVETEPRARPAAVAQPQAAVKADKKDKKTESYTLVSLDEGDDKWVENKAASIHPALGNKVAHFMGLPKGEQGATLKRAFFSYTPYAIFLLMPVFAGLLKLLYLGSGRRYGEHLLFALHTNAFAFLMLSLLLILPEAIPLLGTALMLWLTFYLPTAMRKVYGGGRTITALRWIVLMTMHLFCSVLAVLAVFFLAVVV